MDYKNTSFLSGAGLIAALMIVACIITAAFFEMGIWEMIYE